MENFTKTIERLAHYVESKGISLNKFSVDIGVSNSYFSKMIKNKASVGSDIIEKIVSLYPDLNTDWLISGKGQMLRGNSDNNMIDKPVGPCQQCELRDEIISEKNEIIGLLKDKIRTLNEQLQDTGHDVRQTG